MTLPINDPPVKLSQHREREITDPEVARAILNEAQVCHVSILDGEWPLTIPMAFALLDDHLLLHGSQGSRLMTKLSEGANASISVTLLDALVLARSAFYHSMNYRSVVLFGKVVNITNREEKMKGAWALTEKYVPGRWESLRPVTEHELNRTMVLAFDLTQLSIKSRSGPPADPAGDLSFPVWAGIIPIETRKLSPIADPKILPDIEFPFYLKK